jgi:hypothetical protein
MAKKKKTTHKPAKGKDWRSLPRKPEALKRSVKRSIAITPSDLDAWRANAAAAGLTLVDYFIRQCCHKGE